MFCASCLDSCETFILLSQVRQAGKQSHPGSGSSVFGVTTCDTASISGNQCHATSACVPSNSCAGTSLTYKVTACSTIGFFAYFHQHEGRIRGRHDREEDIPLPRSGRHLCQCTRISFRHADGISGRPVHHSGGSAAETDSNRCPDSANSKSE